MNFDVSRLPDNNEELKDFIASLIQNWTEHEEKYKEKISYLEERIRLLQNEIFGRKTEKRSDSDPAHIQMNLFNEPEAAPAEKTDDEMVIPGAYSKETGQKVPSRRFTSHRCHP